MRDIFLLIIPIVTVFISVFGSFWVTTNQIINSKSTERLSLLRREFADFLAYCSMIMHVNKAGDELKLEYAKKGFHIILLLNAESKPENEMRSMLNVLVNKVPEYLDKTGITREEIITDIDKIGDKFDLIMKIENAKLKQKLIYKLIPFISR